MALSTFRILKRHRRLTLVETANPALGLGYSVRDGSLGLWSGEERPISQSMLAIEHEADLPNLFGLERPLGPKLLSGIPRWSLLNRVV
jgi:hypothetical protein